MTTPETPSPALSSVGETLRQARQKLGVSASAAAAATRIKMQTIEAMERGDFSGIAAPIYVKGFLKMYAEYLRLDAAALIAAYTGAPAQAAAPAAAPAATRADATAEKAPPAAPKAHSAPPAARRRNLAAPLLFAARRLRSIGFAAAAADRLDRAATAVAAEPWKCLSIAVGVLIIVVFVLSGLKRCSGRGPADERRGPRGNGQSAAQVLEPPPPYLSTEP